MEIEKNLKRGCMKMRLKTGLFLLLLVCAFVSQITGTLRAKDETERFVDVLVLDEDQKPIAGAKVTAVASISSTRPGISETAAWDFSTNSGGVVKSRIRATAGQSITGEVSVNVSANGYKPGSGSGPGRIIVILKKKAQTGKEHLVNVLVLDEKQKPISGAKVTAVATISSTRPGISETASWEFTTNSGGIVKSRIRAPAGQSITGEASVNVSANGYKPGSGSGSGRITIILKKKAASQNEPLVDVLVLDEDQKPIGKASVTAVASISSTLAGISETAAWKFTTNSAGVVKTRIRAPVGQSIIGPVSVNVSANDYDSGSGAGPGRIIVVLKKKGKDQNDDLVDVLVIDEDEEPIEGAKVKAVAIISSTQPGTSETGIWEFTTNSAGIVNSRIRAPAGQSITGPVSVDASADGYESGSGSGPGRITIVLKKKKDDDKEPLVDVLVIDEDQNPIEGANVKAVAIISSTQPGTSETGIWEFTTNSAGIVNSRIRAPIGQTIMGPVSVDASADGYDSGSGSGSGRITIVLKKKKDDDKEPLVDVLVIDEKRNPIEGAKVKAVAIVSRTQPGTSETGIWKFTTNSAGVVHSRIRAPVGQTITGPVSVDASADGYESGWGSGPGRITIVLKEKNKDDSDCTCFHPPKEIASNARRYFVLHEDTEENDAQSVGEIQFYRWMAGLSDCRHLSEKGRKFAAEIAKGLTEVRKVDLELNSLPNTTENAKRISELFEREIEILERLEMKMEKFLNEGTDISKDFMKPVLGNALKTLRI